VKLAAIALAALLQLPSGSEPQAQGLLVSPQFGLLAQTTLAVRRREAGQRIRALDHGRWRDVTPPRMRGHLWALDFLDARHGWVFAGDCVRGSSGFFRTSDGGRSWTTFHPRAGVGCHAGDRAQVEFVDARHGWLVTVAATGHGASLLRTTDGGRSWREVDHVLPTLGMITFRTATEGWLARSGFAAGAGVWRSRDGGRTWSRVLLRPPPGWSPTALFPDVPRFFGRRGVLPITLSAPHRSAVGFYTTSDGGRTWRAARIVPSTSPLGVSGPNDLFPSYATVSAASLDDWWFVQEGRRPRILVTHDRGRHWLAAAIPARRARSFQLSAVDGRRAWLTAHSGLFTTEVMTTSNGGRTWRPVRPPH
jgi:photosystem II stability/assembly factor-like uncharacterized protein